MMGLTWYELLLLLGIPSIISGLVVAALQMFYLRMSDKRKEKSDDESLVKKALQALLRDRLREHYVVFMEQGYIEVADKDNFENLYNIYHRLGKNGVMDDMYKAVRKLPVNRPKKK